MDTTKKQIETVLKICIELLLIGGYLAEIHCPDVSIEQGGVYSIACTSNHNITDFYWYRGRATTFNPILKLEGEKKGGTEYGSTAFDITPSGAMVVLDANIKHESFYTFIGYYDINHFEKASFVINITITPESPCPYINECEPCTRCVLVPKGSGKLTCGVRKARPAVSLQWKVIFQSGIFLFTNDQVQKPGNITHTWDTSVTVNFTVEKPCTTKALLQCMAVDHPQGLIKNVSLIEINIADNCSSSQLVPSLNQNEDMPLLILLPAICVALFGVLVSVVCIIWVVHRRLTRNSGKEDATLHMDTVEPLLQEVKNQGRYSKELEKDVGFIINGLKKAYKKYCYIKALPWGESIPIATLYVECNCKVYEKDGVVRRLSSGELLADEHLRCFQRLVIVGKLGFGKTTLAKHLIQQWTEGCRGNKYLLVYVPLKDVWEESYLSDIVRENFSPDGTTATCDIEKVLREVSCLVLLDGLDELSIAANEKNREKQIKDPVQQNNTQCSYCNEKTTIGDLLKGENTLPFDNFNVWVTSRSMDYLKCFFPERYVRVELEALSEEQITEYIEKTCNYYLADKAISMGSTQGCTSATGRNGKGNQQTIKHGEFETESKMTQDQISKGQQEQTTTEKHIRDYSKLDSYVSKVKEVCDENDIIQDFIETPALLILIIHILSAQNTQSKRSQSNNTILKLTSLMRVVTDCLERRYQEKRTSKIDFDLLEQKLGEIAFNNDMKKVVMQRRQWIEEMTEDYLDRALQIGLLQGSKSIPHRGQEIHEWTASSYTGITFFHSLLEQYLAALYIVKNINLIPVLEEKLQKRKNDERLAVLKFISALDESLLKDVCRILEENKMYNNFIDCLHETDAKHKADKSIKNIGEGFINIKYLNSRYHREAVKVFLGRCLQLKVELNFITFQGQCSLELFHNLTLPRIDTLEFFQVNFKYEEFVQLVKHIVRQRRTNIVRCKVPETFNGDFEKEEKARIYCKMSGKDYDQELDFKNGKWQRRGIL